MVTTPPEAPVTLSSVLTSSRISRRDAELLVTFVLQQDHAFLLAHPELELSPAQAHRLDTLITRRALGEPLQYLTGTQEFYGLPMLVTPAVLIPRPETEHLVEAVLLWATPSNDEPTLRIIDIGTGSGAIAIALATHLGGADFTALDISPAALDHRRARTRAHTSAPHRIQFLTSDLLSALAPEIATGVRFDAVVANPPYVPVADMPHTAAAEVRDHEPHTALFAPTSPHTHADGLDIYRRLIPEAHAAPASRQGLLALEFGYGQRDAVALAPRRAGTTFASSTTYQGIPRIALAIRSLALCRPHRNDGHTSSALCEFTIISLRTVPTTPIHTTSTSSDSTSPTPQFVAIAPPRHRQPHAHPRIRSDQHTRPRQG